MRRFFVRNLLFVIAVNVIVKPVWVFLIDRNVQNTVHQGEYGTYQALMSLSIIFQILLDFGITNYNSRTIARNPEKIGSVFPAMLSARVALMLSYILIALIGGWAFGYRGWELGLLFGVLLIQSLNALVSFIRSNISALHKFKTDGILSITDRLLMIIICGILLLFPATFGSFKISWFIAAQIFCYLFTAVAGLIFLKRIAAIKFQFSLQLSEVLGIMKQSFPYALLIFQMSVYNRADAMMIERLSGDGKVQADIWAAAFRLLDVSNMFGLLFATMLLPIFGRMLSQKSNVQPIIKLSVNLMLPFSFIVAVASFFFADNIMATLYKACRPSGTPLASEYAMVFKWLMASFPAWCMMYVYSTLLTANGDLKKLNLIAFLGVVVNLSLNFYLIPKYGAAGGAVTSFTTQTLLALIFIFIAQNAIKLPVSVKWILAHIAYFVLSLLIAWCTTNFIRVNWLFQLVIFGMLSVAMMFVLRFVSLSGIKLLTDKNTTQ